MAELLYIPSFLTDEVANAPSLYSDEVTGNNSDEPSDGCTSHTCGNYSGCSWYSDCSSYSVSGGGEEVLPDPPKKGSIIDLTATKDSITVVYQSISGATGYIVSCKNVETGDIQQEDTTRTEVTFTGLEPGTKYTISYYGYNDGGNGPSTSKNITTLTEGGCVSIYHQQNWHRYRPYIGRGGQWVKYNAYYRGAGGGWEKTP